MHTHQVPSEWASSANPDGITLEQRIFEILHEEEDTWTLLLTKLYQSMCCSFLYIAMAVMCTILVVWSLIVGRVWNQGVLFLIFEIIVNVFVILDIVFKMKLLVSSLTARDVKHISEIVTTLWTLS